jgi:hypothetical protein
LYREKIYLIELFFTGLYERGNLSLGVGLAVANETGVADTFQVSNPVGLLWRYAGTL